MKGEVTDLEMENFLVQIEEAEWTEQKSSSVLSETRKNAKSFQRASKAAAAGMEKLLKNKFVKPGRYIPTKINSVYQGSATKKRKAPLQPGQYMQHYYKRQGQATNYEGNAHHHLHRESQSQFTRMNHHYILAQQPSPSHDIVRRKESNATKNVQNKKTSGSTISIHGENRLRNVQHVLPHESIIGNHGANQPIHRNENAFVANDYDPATFYEEEEDSNCDEGTCDEGREKCTNGNPGYDDKAILSNSAMLDLFQINHNERIENGNAKHLRSMNASEKPRAGQTGSNFVENKDGELPKADRNSENTFLLDLMHSEAQMESTISNADMDDKTSLPENSDDNDVWQDENEDDSPWDIDLQEKISIARCMKTQQPLSSACYEEAHGGCDDSSIPDSNDIGVSEPGCPLTFDIHVDNSDSSSSSESDQSEILLSA